MAGRKKGKAVEQLIYAGDRSDYVWKAHEGNYFLTKTNAMGYIEEVCGTVSPTADGSYVGCAQNRFGTYAQFDTLEKAKIHVLAITALEGENHDIS